MPGQALGHSLDQCERRTSVTSSASVKTQLLRHQATGLGPVIKGAVLDLNPGGSARNCFLSLDHLRKAPMADAYLAFLGARHWAGRCLG